MGRRAGDVFIRMDGPMYLFAIAIGVIVVVVVALERRSNIQRNTEEPNGYQRSRDKSHLNASKYNQENRAGPLSQKV